MNENPLRHLPAVNEVLLALRQRTPLAELAGDWAATLAREEIDALRHRLRAGGSANGHAHLNDLASRVASRLEASHRPRLVPVINATGILLHTNLGRAPLAPAAATAAERAGGGYLNLEMDLETGQRSSRQAAVAELLRRLLGAPAATVVNNNAAATVIALRALAQGREVLVSRGELVEIGGSFRIPEIMAVSGATLKEVGTTNITRLQDFEAAISDRTAALLRVHASNYKIVGHTAAPSLQDMVTLGKARGLLVIDDVGSGALVDFSTWGLTDEPMPRESLRVGADLVLFSGDKLLGGPQAGILAGRPDLIQRIESDPLMRAFRIDKMTLAALEATLRLYLDPGTLSTQLPLLAMITATMEELRQRGSRLLAVLSSTGMNLMLRESRAFVGGGSLPGQDLPSVALVLIPTEASAASLARRLRLGQPAVVARIEKEEIHFDLRSLLPGQELDLTEALRGLAASPS